MTCVICKNKKMTRGTTVLPIERRKAVLLVTDIPARLSQSSRIVMEDILRILIVDDSALYRQMIKNVLRHVPNVEVVGIAKTGQEALDSVNQLKPHLLTLDVQMPEMTGIEVLRQLKKLRSRSKAIMISSLTALA